jgi:hypothetical protein
MSNINIYKDNEAEIIVVIKDYFNNFLNLSNLFDKESYIKESMDQTLLDDIYDLYEEDKLDSEFIYNDELADEYINELINLHVDPKILMIINKD